MRSALHLVFAGFVLIGGCGTSDSPIKGQSKTPKPTPPKKTLLAPKVQMVVYDFDQTLPVIHVFHKTRGAREVSQLDDAFFVEAFGGPERISRLKKHFGKLSKNGTTCLIVSYGFTDVIKESLERVGLADYFDNANIHGRDSASLTRHRGAKHKLIAEEMSKRNFSKDQVIFADDDLRNIEACIEAKICRTMHVAKRSGLTELQLDTLEKLK